MPASILQIADALVTALEAASFTAPYNTIEAQRTYQPEYTLAELENLKVDVVPLSAQRELGSRTHLSRDEEIAIGIQKRTGGETAAIDALVYLTEEIADYCLTLTLASGQATCIGVRIDPLFAEGNLRESRVFTSVIVCTFRRYDTR